MERPHCGKCHSTSVYLDSDLGTKEKSIACSMCGNRYPGGSGFYMAEKARKEIDVTTKKECVNCKRLRTIVRDDMCWSCAHAVKGITDGQDRAAALEEIRTKIDQGKVKQRGAIRKSREEPSSQPAEGRTDRGTQDGPKGLIGGERTEPGPDPVSPTRGKSWLEPARERLLRELSIPGTHVLSIEFRGADEALYHQFCAFSHKLRRSPEDELLAMIEDVVKTRGGVQA